MDTEVHRVDSIGEVGFAQVRINTKHDLRLTTDWLSLPRLFLLVLDA